MLDLVKRGVVKLSEDVFNGLAAAVRANDGASVAMLLAIAREIAHTPPPRLFNALRRLLDEPPPPAVPITGALRDFAALWRQGHLPGSAAEPNRPRCARS